MPGFKGDIKSSPFLKFPVWLNKWEKIIVDYEDKLWNRLLQKKLNEAALRKIVGFKDYVEAMKYWLL